MGSIEALTENEREALSRLQAVTQGANVDVQIQISLLQSLNWDVQAALQAIYGEEATTRPAGVSRPIEPLEVDDTDQYYDLGRSRYTAPAFPRRDIVGLGLFSTLLSPVTFSLNLFSSLFHFIFRVLRIPFPRFNTLSFSFNQKPRRGSYSDDPSVVSERWVRELEEETGAVCISKAGAIEANNMYQGNNNEPGSSTKPIRRQHGIVKIKTLPDFMLVGYDAALRICQREAKVLCVILTSEEHDDVPEFRRTVLTDAGFVRTLTENDILVWGGDVCERDGYQAALKLGATTYPFVAFVSLYTRVNRADALTVITRHSGPSDSITSATALSGHIVNTVLPRVAPVLNRKRAEMKTREAERRLREEQDNAFANSQRKDYERIMKRREEERIKKEKEAELERAAHDLATRAEKRVRWMRYARRNLVPAEVSDSTTATTATVRIRVRLPSGKLISRCFQSSDTVTGLYAFVATQFIPVDEGGGDDDDPCEPPEEITGDIENHEWDWAFKLAVAFPRTLVPATPGSRLIGSEDSLRGGAILVVEKESHFPSQTSGTESEEDSE